MISQTLPSKPPVAWALAFVALILAATLFNGCSEPLAPMLPAWDVDANLPLINKTYTMGDILTDKDMLRITRDGEQTLIITQCYPMDAITLGDHLRIDDYEFSTSEKFSALRFDIPDYMDQQLNVYTLFPNLPMGSQVVHALQNDLGIAIAIDTREYFEEMVFASGKLILEFENNTPIPLRLEDIRLVDTKGTTLGRSNYANPIQPGQRVTLTAIQLDNVTLTNSMRLSFDVSTPGSSGNTVDLSSANSLGVRAELTETDILSVRGFLPSQTLSYERAYNITNGSGLRLRDGLIRDGKLNFLFDNDFGVGAEVALTVHSITKSGAPLSATTRVEANSTKSISIALAGATILLQHETDISYSAHIVTDDAGATPVTVHRGDLVKVTGSLRNVSLSTMTGTLAPATLRVDNMRVSDFPIDKSITASLSLSEARMWALLRNDAMLPIGVSEARILGKSVQGTSAQLPIAAVDITGNTQTIIDFDNAKVAHFLNSFSPDYPDSLGMQGDFVLNPTREYGSVTAEDRITGDVFLEFPMRFTQLKGSVVDTIPMVIAEDSRKKMEEVNEGTLTFDLENHLPTEVIVEAEFLDTRYRVLLSPVAVDGSPLRVGPAPVDQKGFVSHSIIERLILHFTAEDFSLLGKAEHIRFRISFDTQENNGSFRSTDYVRIRGAATLNINTAFTEK
ncbi:MAG: hypothetical protein KFH87_04685 [Bacteroidetes bacterium]|nr:hypothetical protein [Bacteroidota bacterium]